ncbi:hypothetical protein [Micromonospora schwarzwaldensis]|uniref:hypothetical protein n=1 Tax=Micromonospora sp. DSM 45708 TaxID=3111767 RepID=UPI0031E0B958
MRYQHRLAARLALVATGIVATLLLGAAPASAAEGDIRVSNSSSPYSECWYDGFDGSWSGDASSSGSRITFNICWSGNHAVVDGAVYDTAPDGRAGRAWLQYQYWNNPIEGWRWHAPVLLATTSGGQGAVRYFSGNSDLLNVRNYQIRTCAGPGTDRCSNWR